MPILTESPLHMYKLVFSQKLKESLLCMPGISFLREFLFGAVPHKNCLSLSDLPLLSFHFCETVVLCMLFLFLNYNVQSACTHKAGVIIGFTGVTVGGFLSLRDHSPTLPVFSS